MKVSATEAASLLESLTKTTPDDHPALIVVNGVEYQPILVEKNRIYAEMVRNGCFMRIQGHLTDKVFSVARLQKSNINAGLIVLLGKQCIVVGTYPPSVQPGLAVDSAERLHVYLGEQGF